MDGTPMTWKALRCLLFVGHDWHLVPSPTRLHQRCVHCGTDRHGIQLDKKRQQRLEKRRKTQQQVESTVQPMKRRA